MADQTQPQIAPTPVSFDDVSLAHLTFNETFRVTRGAASQVVLGLKNMLTKLSSPTNEYQKSLYPQLSTLTQSVVSKYEETFLSVTDSVQRQVYGANLNGHRNDGSLYRSVNSGVNRSLTYGYAQFGQLLKVLTSRLKFVVNRDPTTVKRYSESAEESTAYVTLQTLCNDFLSYLTAVNDEWTKTVDGARTQHNIQKTPRTPRTPRTNTDHQVQREQRTVRNVHSTQHGETQTPSQSRDGQEWVTVRVKRNPSSTRTQQNGSTSVRHHRTKSTTLDNSS
jgi:hypothetical protein